MGIKIITQNRKAWHDYHILEVFEAGLVLTGSEVKSLRLGNAQLKDSYIFPERNELFMRNVHISPYTASSYNNHEPERARKLLMHREEIDKIVGKFKERGYTMVPLKMYFKEGIVKVEVAFVKGKKSHDRREDIKKRDVKKELDRQVRRNR